MKNSGYTRDPAFLIGVIMYPKLFTIASIALISGCSTFTPPKERPVIEDKVGERIGALATTAERRVVLVDLKKDHFCAEAAPDVAESLNSTIRIAAEYASKSASGPERSASAEIARSLSTSVTGLFSRTQGVQLFRDGSYALCQANMNGAIEDKDFKSTFERLLEHSVALIRQEIPEIAARATQSLVTQAQSAAADAKAAAAKAESSAAAAERAASSPK